MGSYFSNHTRHSEDNIQFGSRRSEEGGGSEQNLRTVKGHTVVDTAGQLERENRRLKEENHVLSQKVRTLELELEEMTGRLSAYLSAQVSADERHLENIGETVRPSSLGKRFRQLESTEWVSAKEQIDNNNSIPSHDALKLLCLLMDAAYDAARTEVTRCEAEMLHMLLSPARYQNPSSNDVKDIPERQCIPDTKGLDAPLISQQLKNEISKCMKKTSHFVDLSVIEDNVTVKAAETFTLPEGFFASHDEVQKYVKACCRLAWQFRLVQPPMVVSTEPTTYERNIHNLWYESDDDTNEEIQLYIWPILYHYEGGGVASKGRVMLRKGQPDDESATTTQETAESYDTEL